MEKKKKILFFVVLFVPVFLAAIAVIVIDPFFHYHAPIKGVPYVLQEERYQNDGIVKHFDYEALITGSSTSQNFKTSDIARIWGIEAVKVPFAGATFKEQDSIIKTASACNPNLKMVVRGIDINGINVDKDEMTYDSYPEYLYDENPFNDFDYLFNKDVVETIGKEAIRFISHKGSETFDEYSNWNDSKVFGRDAVLSTFERVEKADKEEEPLSEEDYKRIYDNITQNVISSALENPDTDFYIFIPPSNICFWDALIRSGYYDNIFDELRYVYELLLKVENIKLYSFFDKTEITCNLDNYIDTIHYGEDINTYLLECMKRGEGLMTTDNYMSHLDSVKEIYADIDYESVFQ